MKKKKFNVYLALPFFPPKIIKKYFVLDLKPTFARLFTIHLRIVGAYPAAYAGFV